MRCCECVSRIAKCCNFSCWRQKIPQGTKSDVTLQHGGIRGIATGASSRRLFSSLLCRRWLAQIVSAALRLTSLSFDLLASVIVNSWTRATMWFPNCVLANQCFLNQCCDAPQPERTNSNGLRRHGLRPCGYHGIRLEVLQTERASTHGTQKKMNPPDLLQHYPNGGDEGVPKNDTIFTSFWNKLQKTNISL